MSNVIHRRNSKNGNKMGTTISTFPLKLPSNRSDILNIFILVFFIGLHIDELLLHKLNKKTSY